ncbi:nuclease [Clostridia bacterium]|nr:nuclease [Clostridia bacterium]
MPTVLDGAGCLVYMSERDIERRLVIAVNAAGGRAFKFVSPGTDGMPDRIILFPGGRAAFVEVKSTGHKPRPLQLKKHEMLRSLGFQVFILDDPNQIINIIMEVKDLAI